ncbi:MAG: peptidoglycan editing factor PgeF [Candidatus Omnitrophota bacterium]
MSFVYGDTKDTLLNRRNFLRQLNINYESLVCANQVHGSRIAYISEADKGRGAVSADTALADTDGLITNVKNLPLAIFTADCLAIFLYDPIKHGIGLIHAGWRGARAGIISKAVESMQEKFNSNPENLLAGFGPFLRRCCYQVGEEFKDYFTGGLLKTNNHYYLDLAAVAKEQLLQKKVKKTNISDPGDCTFCNNDKYFSYRKEGSSAGRLMAVIMLK